MLMKHYGLNKNSLTNKIGYTSNSVIGRIVNDPTRSPSFDLMKELILHFPEINARWLVSGEGDMLGRELATYDKGEVRYYKIGSGEPFSIENKRATAIMLIPSFKDCEAAFDVQGDGMAPRFKHGDVIICTDHTDKLVLLGEAYLLVSNNIPTIRIIKNQTDLTYKLSAENSRLEDYEINKSDISKLYLIKGLVRREVY